MQSLKKNPYIEFQEQSKASFLGSNYGKNNPTWGKGSFLQKLGSVPFFEA